MVVKGWHGPLFIVGASRSGTAMLRSILSRSSEVGLAGETHFFDDLRPRFLNKSLREMTESERANCADYFRKQTVRPYGVRADPEESPLSSTKLLADAEALGGNIDSLFEAYCRWYADQHGNRIWGEKTPRHIFRIDDILTAFPDAKIICMVRDPRAVVASYRDWTEYQGGISAADGNQDYLKALEEDFERKRASYNPVIASLMWRAAARAAVGAAKKHTSERVRVVNYEDVVSTPEDILKSLSDWIGIEYHQDMLVVPLLNSSVTQYQEQAGISDAPNKRWREVLSDSEIHVIQSVCGPSLNAVGYDRLPTKSGALTLAKAYTSLPSAVWRAARANRSRFDSLPDYMLRRIKAAFR